jgi:hypothetical protein
LSICGGGKEEDAGVAVREAAGAGAVSPGLSIDEGMTGGDRDDVCVRREGVMEAAVG